MWLQRALASRADATVRFLQFRKRHLSTACATTLIGRLAAKPYSSNREPVLRCMEISSSWRSHECYQPYASRLLHKSAGCQRDSTSANGTGNVIAFNLSDIGEGISEVTIKEWFVKPGNRVNQFDPICEVQSDKASVTITSRYDGVIVKLYCEVGGICKVGQTLVDIQMENPSHDTQKSQLSGSTEKVLKRDSAEKAYSSTSPPNGNGNIIAFNLSDIGEGISEVTIKEWFVQEGSSVSQFDPICEVQSDKASVTITSRYDGVVVKLHHQVEGLCKVGSPLVDIQLIEDDSANIASAVSQPFGKNERNAITDTSFTSNTSFGNAVENFTEVKKALATPAVRRLANELKVPLHKVAGTGKSGRVLKDDIFTYLEAEQATSSHQQATNEVQQVTTASSTQVAAASVTGVTQQFRRPLEARTVPLSGYTRVMVKTMSKSLEIPHFGYKDEVDMTYLVNLRKEMAEEAKAQGVQLSYMPFMIKAASMALFQYPVLNASLSSCKEKMIFKSEHNIGVAMDTSQGLIVPNIKNCQEKSVLEIGAELNRLHAASLSGRVDSSDLTDGTFSLSNIGSIGGTYAFPVIVQPEVCIGALGKIQKLPRYAPDGTIQATFVLNVSWSADHRCIDGATVARFSNLWKRFLEKPYLLMMHLR